MSKGQEDNRIYVNSNFSGLNVGYIEVNQDQAKFVKKQELFAKQPKFISFHSAFGKYFRFENSENCHSRIVDLNSPTTALSYTYACDFVRECPHANHYYYERMSHTNSVKSPTATRGEYSYFALVDVFENEDRQRMFNVITVFVYKSSADYWMQNEFCAGSYRIGYNAGIFVFEFIKDQGSFLFFTSSQNNSSDYDFDIGIKKITCSHTNCSSGSYSYIERNCWYASSYIASVKKDTNNPYIFYVTYTCQGYFQNIMLHLDNDGQISNTVNVADQYNRHDNYYGFSVQLGNDTTNTASSAFFLVGYFDKYYGKFRVGLSRSTEYYNNIFYLNPSYTSSFNANAFKVTHNGVNDLQFPNSFFYASSSTQSCVLGFNYCGSFSSSCPSNVIDCFNYVDLNSNKSLRVSAAENNKDLRDEAGCNDEEDFLLVGDYFYYCVSSCEDYFSTLTLQNSQFAHSCENKIGYTDYGKPKSRCVAGFVENASNCPDLSFPGHENYRFRYIHSNYVEYRYDCRGDHILKPTEQTVTAGVEETGTCGTCNYSEKRLVLSSSHLYFDDSNNQTAVKRKYCFDKCDIAPFLIRYETVENEVTSYYCTETCVKALSTTEVPVEIPFRVSVDNGEDYCADYCPSGKNYVTSANGYSSISGILSKPVCYAACPDNTNYRVHTANFTDAFDNVWSYNYCLDNCNIEDKKFTQQIGDLKHCVAVCPSSERFYYNASSADNQFCVSVCPSSHPYIVGYHTHTGNPAEIVEGQCKSACESSTHFKYEMSTGVYLCLEQCYPNPNLVENDCATSACQPYRSFFQSDRICVKDCPEGSKHLQVFSGVIDTITNDSTRGVCTTDCASTNFKYMNPSSTCINCPGSCSEASIAARTDSIYAGSVALSDLNNGCARVHCLSTECHSDKSFFTPQKICHSDCPPRYKHLQSFTGITAAIEYNSAKGLCETDCPTGYFKYMNPTHTCSNCAGSCSEADIDSRTDSIYAGSASVSDLNNGCARVHCLSTKCHSDKPFFTPQKICHLDCPPRYKHLQSFTGIIAAIEYNSAKGLCETDCPTGYFKYISPTVNCSESDISNRIANILAGTVEVSDLNKLCTRVHCLSSKCHSSKPFFTSQLICFTDCPIQTKHLQTFSGILTTVNHDSTEGLCESDCPDNHFKYINPSTTCFNCPSECDESHIASKLALIETGSKPVSDLNNLCARVHCLAAECHSVKPFFTPNLICYTLCPPSHKYIRKFAGIINKMEFNSTKGQCSTECSQTEFIYFNVSTQNQNYCLDKCHEDKPYWDVNRICLVICPVSIPLVNPPNPVLPFSVSMGEGVCKATCESGYNFRYNLPDNSQQYYCLKQCEIPKKYFVRYASFNECLYECPYHLRYVHPDTQECLLECPSTHPYYDSRGICMEKCDDFIFEWECKSSCNPGFNYLVNQGCAALCAKDIVGWDCKPYCPPNYPTQINKYCAVSCLKNQFLDEVVNFSLPNEFGICKLGCDGYLIEGGVFSSGISKIYCVPSCPELYMKEIRSSTEKWCRKECIRDSAWKFTVLGDSCVADCIDLGYKFISEDYECLDECSFSIDREIWCVSKCPRERPFVFNQHCIDKCPGNARFVDKFTFCVPKCESFNYDIFCVDSCNSEELGAYYLDRQLDFRPLPFVHSTLNCAEACNEPGFEWINEINNQCVASCPLPCKNGACPMPEMKYKEPTKYCRKTCNTPEFPFIDNQSLECLPECKAERKFFVEENKVCLSKCPKEKPLIFEKAACQDRGVCDTGCGKIHSTCIDSCPRQAVFTLEKQESKYCLCVCPKFYLPKKGTTECELFCDDKLGVIPNKTEDGCDSCSNEGLFLWEGECIRECPQGTLSNTFSSCRTCKQLGLWRDHTMSCLKYHQCSELSLFDYNNQICTRCDGDGMMVRKVFPGDFVCLKTNCSDGHIILGNIKKCFVCPDSWFFFNETCFKSCPEGFFNDYVRWICTENCFQSCSDDCCVNGTCKINQGSSECTCNSGFVGEKCDIRRENLQSTAESIQIHLINKLKDRLFTKADINALLEFYFYAKESFKSKRNLISVNPLLALNLKLYIEEIRIPFAFQPEVLSLVDSLLLIEHLAVLQSDNKVPFNAAVSFLDTITDDIQIFLTQNSEIQDFERVFEGKFKGQSFSFQFRTDVTEAKEVDVTKCISRILEKENLAFGTRFPFKLLRFSSKIDSVIERQLLHAFNISSKGIFELTFYFNTGLYPLNEVCQENYVDTTEEVQLEPEKKEATQKFINIGINVFDITVPFFNDKCVPYESEDGKDLTLRERKAKLYKDPSELCSESAAKICSVDGFTEEGEAVCVCKGIQDKKKSSLQSFASTYPQTNYILITCYSTFREANIFRNVGFYIVFLSFISFTFSGLRSIFYSDSEIESPKRFRFVRNDVAFFDPETMDIETYFENCYSLQTDLELLMIQVQIKENILKRLSTSEKEHLYAVLPTIYDLKQLSFDQLLEFDRRSHFQFALDIFTEKNILFSTFYMDSLVFPKYFRIMFFVTEFNLNITLNAFFIDDSLVENFNEQEETGLFYSMTNEATKTLWAFLTTKLIISVFRGLYYVSSKNAAHLLRRMKVIDSDYVKRAFNLFLLHTRVASLLFSFTAIIFNLLCAYFVIVFCEIYRNSIDIWINGIYMGWIFEYFVLGGIVPLLLIGSRYLSTKNNRFSFLYKLSNLIDIMLSLGLN